MRGGQGAVGFQPARQKIIPLPWLQLEPTRLHSAAGDGYFESVNDGDSWRRIVDGLKHQYCWSVAISFDDPKTLLLSASNSAYGAHYKESANSVVYRRSGNDAWQLLQDGLPD